MEEQTLIEEWNEVLSDSEERIKVSFTGKAELEFQKNEMKIEFHLKNVCENVDYMNALAIGIEKLLNGDLVEKGYLVTGDNCETVERESNQIDRLASFIMNEVDGEPSEDEGAIDCAIRIMKNFKDNPIREDGTIYLTIREMMNDVSEWLNTKIVFDTPALMREYKEFIDNKYKINE